MALRIGNPNASPPPPAPPEQDEAASLPTAMQSLEAPTGAGMVDPAVARYLGPEMRCQNCVHFMEPGSCEVVSGAIDSQGVCSLHTADMEAEMPMEEEVPAEEPMPEEEEAM